MIQKVCNKVSSSHATTNGTFWINLIYFKLLIAKLFNIISEPTVSDNQFLASFYIDPYIRPVQKLSGTWMEAGRGGLPVSTVQIEYI